MTTKIKQAFDAWETSNDDAVSVETGVEALDELVRSCRGVPGTEALVHAAEALRADYQSYGTDLFGANTERLHEAYRDWEAANAV